MTTGISIHPSILMAIFMTVFATIGAVSISQREPLSKLSRIGIAISIGVLMTILLYIIYALEDWLGILAFRLYYLPFCVLFAAIAVLFMKRLGNSRRNSLLAGLVVAALFVSPYVMKTPSARILREVLLDVKPEMQGDEVEALIRDAYQDSGYEMPIISREEERIHVSLLSQRPGDVTGAIFNLNNGAVVSDSFSPD